MKRREWLQQADYDRAERDARDAYRDALDDAELAYLARLEGEANAAWTRQLGEPAYELEDDVLQGETTQRYDEGKMP